MKQWFKIDTNGYLISAYDPAEFSKNLMKGLTKTGGNAANGFNVDINNIDSIPSDAVLAEVPESIEGFRTKWEIDHWKYESIENINLSIPPNMIILSKNSL